MTPPMDREHVHEIVEEHCRNWCGAASPMQQFEVTAATHDPEQARWKVRCRFLSADR